MKKDFILLMMIVFSITSCSETESGTYSADKLLEYRDSYVGNASAVCNILYLLHVEHSGIELKTDKEPYGIIINVTDSHKLNEKMLFEASIVFALVNNVSTITFVSDNQSVSISREEIDEKYNTDVRAVSDSKEEFINLFGL